MKRYEELTSLGQVRRIRPMAIDLLRQHGKDAHRVSLIHHGENTTFRAWCDDGQYLCRIHRPNYQTPATIRSELRFIAHLRKHGLRVPDPVYCGKKAMIEVNSPTIEPRHAVLFRWLPGRFTTKLSLRGARKLGAFVGELHAATESFRPTKTFDRTISDSAGIYQSLGGRLSDLDKEDRELFQKLKRKVVAFEKRVGKDTGVFNLIHSDLHRGNRLTHNGEIYAIDFDDLTWGWFVYDIMLALDFHRVDANYVSIRDAFVAGYREVRAISDFELKAIPLFTAVRRVQIALWVFGRSDHPDFVKRLPKVLERSRRDVKAFLSQG